MLLLPSVWLSTLSVSSLVSGTGTIERREISPQINRYSIKIKKAIQMEFELPTTIVTFENGQKLTISIAAIKPKVQKTILVLQGEIYDIVKSKQGITYIVFFAGLQGSILVQRALPKAKKRKPIFVSFTRA